jgi:DNA modification methylase
MDGIVYFGDFFDFMKLEILKPESVDLILTDPPWFIKDTDTALKSKKREKEKEHIPSLKSEFPNYLTFMKETLKYFYDVLKPTGNCVIFHNFKMLPTLLVSLYPVGFKIHRDFVWIRTDKPGGKGVSSQGTQKGFKPCTEYIIILKKSDKVYFDANSIVDLMPNGRVFNYWIGSRPLRSNFNFESEKPQELLRIFVRSMSPPGGIVFDPFLGTGSIIPVCIEEGRFIVGCEIDEIAQDMIRHRIAEYPNAKIKIIEEKMR